MTLFAAWTRGGRVPAFAGMMDFANVPRIA
jgi:hypothetical protein